jgi:hypothetical protein
MSERKQTPDVLADILGGPIPTPEPAAPLPVGRITDLPARRPAARASQAKSDTTRAVEKPTPAPATWEYETVSFQDAHGWRPRFVNGCELRNWMFGPLLHDYVNQRGADGWELVAAAAGQSVYGTSDRYQVFFRRSKQG